MASESDRTERVLSALDSSTRVSTEVMGQILNLSRDLGTLKVSQENGLDEVRDEIRTNNAHLDNLIREQAVTNTILNEDMATRQVAEAERRLVDKEEREWRRKTEQEEREWRRKLEDRQMTRKEEIEDDTRGVAKKVMGEAWTVIKQPLGYLIAAVVFFVVLRYLGVQVPPGLLVPTDQSSSSSHP